MILVALLVFVFALCFGLEKVLIPLLRKRGAMDAPNHRSSHSIPTPRGGGLALVVSVLVGLLLVKIFNLYDIAWSLIASVALIATLGFVDDFLKGIPPILRLLLQIGYSVARGLDRGRFHSRSSSRTSRYFLSRPSARL